MHSTTAHRSLRELFLGSGTRLRYPASAAGPGSPLDASLPSPLTYMRRYTVPVLCFSAWMERRG